RGEGALHREANLTPTHRVRSDAVDLLLGEAQGSERAPHLVLSQLHKEHGDACEAAVGSECGSRLREAVKGGERPIVRRGERGRERSERARSLPQRQRRRGTGDLVHRLLELLLYALRREAAEIRRAPLDRGERGRLDGKAEASSEPDCAERAQT